MTQASPRVLIYSKVPCPYCVRAKNFFTAKGVKFEEIDLSGKYDELDALKQRTGHMTLPQIFVNDEFIGGYDDLMERVNGGSLVF